MNSSPLGQEHADIVNGSWLETRTLGVRIGNRLSLRESAAKFSSVTITQNTIH